MDGCLTGAARGAFYSGSGAAACERVAEGGVASPHFAARESMAG